MLRATKAETMNAEEAEPSVKETEVLAKAKRRGFTAEYKQRILNEVDQAVASGRSGEAGVILRREGLYSSNLATWRRLREAGELSALTAKKRGPKPKAVDADDREKRELKKKLALAEARLKRAEALLGVQKKVADLFGIELLPPPPNEEPS
jgi:transposase-like protein